MLRRWFAEVMVRCHESVLLPFEEFSRQFYVFPFIIDMTLAELYRNENLDVRREGMDSVFVGLKERSSP